MEVERQNIPIEGAIVQFRKHLYSPEMAIKISRDLPVKVSPQDNLYLNNPNGDPTKSCARLVRFPSRLQQLATRSNVRKLSLFLSSLPPSYAN